jgi:UDP-N-acetylglucosamine--N-acetylmuramyl-(pentapeptide) pyrophosphoryl-undecaprenol N-acetylglucosamine transferase
VRILIAGGGTGGHLFPGLAVAGELKSRDGSAEIVFAGTEHGIEARVVPREGYQIRFMRAEGISGLPAGRKLKAFSRMPISLADAHRILKSIRPDLVIGVGGYASGAVVLLACFMSVPTMILEQNAMPGITNRILGRFVDTVCITYPESSSYFPRGKTFLTGNPVRTNIQKAYAEDGLKLFSLQRGLFTIFVFGGSAGARSINRAMVEALQYLKDISREIQFLHQTGPADFEHVKEAYRTAGFSGTVTPFVYQMGDAYAVADLVISRAGATTLAEITALGKPAVLIPYPHAAADHQELNARKLEEIGAARVIADRDLKGEAVAGVIREIIENSHLLSEMKKQSHSVGRPEARSKVADIALSLIKCSSIGFDHQPGEVR